MKKYRLYLLHYRITQRSPFITRKREKWQDMHVFQPIGMNSLPVMKPRWSIIPII